MKTNITILQQSKNDFHKHLRFRISIFGNRFYDAIFFIAKDGDDKSWNVFAKSKYSTAYQQINMIKSEDLYFVLNYLVENFKKIYPK